MNFKFTQCNNLKEKPTYENLGFGKHFTDYMFKMEYDTKNGWHNGEILPYSPFSFDPATLVFHYGIEVFEGMKAYVSQDNEVLLFRPDMNAKRFQTSCKRLCIPEIPIETFIAAVNNLVYIEKDWVPKFPNTSLYIRPFVISTEVGVGVHPSVKYTFLIILTPVSSYYKEGLEPTKLLVEETYSRAIPGGTGDIKCGGNYAASLLAQEKANSQGFTQVLWLDAINKKYIEEVGTMNVVFVIDNEIYTPPLNGSILPGITRDSCLKVLKNWGYKINETPISIDKLIEYYKNGELQEAFGTGTAAVISPIGALNYRGETITINNFKTGTLTRKLYDELTEVQYGRREDIFDWSFKVTKF